VEDSIVNGLMNIQEMDAMKFVGMVYIMEMLGGNI
jgi:hypothetical protein